jgi:hypothetical protein
MRVKNITSVIICGLFLSACDGGSDSSSNMTSSSSSDTIISIVKNFTVDTNSSHTLQASSLYVDKQSIRTVNQSNFVLAIAYADFDNDGDEDIFMASGNGSENPTPFELYLNDGNNNFTLDENFLDKNTGLIHPRKALVGDYNGDGKYDIFVIGHGYDQPPFPGEAPAVLLSSEDGFKLGSGLDELIGFHHGGASADIDADGDIDVFLTDNFNRPFFLINDGKGNFTKDTSRLSNIDNTGMYTAELVDVDKDGYVDLLLSGHAQDGFIPKIVWGNESGIYSSTNMTLLPTVANFGVTIDIDVADIDNDGKKDIVLTSSGDGTGELVFYQGYNIEIIKNLGKRNFQQKMSITDENAQWIEWIYLQDFNNDGDIDIVVDDASRNLIWYNNGQGNFD